MKEILYKADSVFITLMPFYMLIASFTAYRFLEVMEYDLVLRKNKWYYSFRAVILLMVIYSFVFVVRNNSLF